MAEQERKQYEAPSVQLVKINTDGMYMQLMAGSDGMGIEPGGNASDYDIERG